MNRRELAFCAHYHVNRNAVAAATAAGYKTPRSNAHRILGRTHVQEQLNFLAMRTAEIVALDAGVVINEYGAIALTRPDELMAPSADGRWSGKRPEELSERQRASVKQIHTHNVYVDQVHHDDAGKVVGVEKVFSHQEFRYVMHDKMTALLKLGEHFDIGGGYSDPGRANPFEDMPQAQLDELTRAYNEAMAPKLIEGETV